MQQRTSPLFVAVAVTLCTFGVALYSSGATPTPKPSPPVASASKTAISTGKHHISAAEAVRLGFDKFIDLYSRQTNDYSTAGQIQAYSFYESAKRNANDRRIRGWSAGRRTQIGTIRRELSRLGETAWTTRYLLSGGGTMWGQIEASAEATREDFIGSIITQWPRHSRKWKAREARQVRNGFNKTQGLLSQLGREPVDDFDQSELPRMRAMFRTSLQHGKDAVSRLRQKSQSLPPEIALQVAQRAYDEIHRSMDMG